MTLVVIGPGLIGRSIALAARRANPDVAIVEIDRGQPLTEAGRGDVIVIAAPVDAILEIIRTDADRLRPALTIDTGSTKRAIVAAAREADLPNFVGGHPMAGAATSGTEGARADLFDDRPWFLVPHGAAAEAVDRAHAFVELLGARPLMLDDDGSEHDRVMAAVSHLPQVVASQLMTLAADTAGERLSWSGSGLRDTTRLAGSTAAMWQSLLASNAAELRPLLLTLAEQLARFAHRLDDPDAVHELFERANAARAILERQGR